MKASVGIMIALAQEMLMLRVDGFTWPLVTYRGTLISIVPSAIVEPDNCDEPTLDIDGDLSLEAFQKAKKQVTREVDNEKEFDGYDFRDIIYAKWGQCYDVDFNRVDSFGFKRIYLNIYPFYLGRKPFRHETEFDYLCHLQAVVEILQEYGQLNYVLYQIQETNKRPLPGRSPLVAVPCRLDLTDEQVKSILRGKKKLEMSLVISFRALCDHISTSFPKNVTGCMMLVNLSNVLYR